MMTTTTTTGVSDELVRRYVTPSPAAPLGVVPTQRTASDGQQADAQHTDELWERYKATGDPAAREALILHYVPLVGSVAARIGMRLPSMVEQADLVSYGMFGLIDAIEKFETSRAVRFESYASSRIRGAILDELRALDWVPRSVRSKSRAVDRAYAELEAELFRAPSRTELADRLGVTGEELNEMLTQISTANVTTLDDSGPDDRGGQPYADRLVDRTVPDPAFAAEALETSHLLGRAIEALADRERLVVVLYYYERRTLAEIGRVLGVTESRVSQMHTAAVGRLRHHLALAEAC